MRILIVAGGTGGHIFPAISLAQKVKEIDPSAEIIFCVDSRVDEEILKKANFKYFIINPPKMPYGITFKWISFAFKLLFSFSDSRNILKEVAPGVVVGFGAYISGPILMQAKKENIKIVIHEQNVVMGRANRILSKIADKIAIGFENKQYLKNKKVILTGNPIRDLLLEDSYALDKERSRRLLGLDLNTPTVLVMGGSLGSRAINTVFLQMLQSHAREIQQHLQIIHLTGKAEFDNVQSIYKNINIKVNIYPFYERMSLLYKAADLAICRAGAITLSELCLFGVPAILIPYRGAGAHQRHNAALLKERNAAIVIDEKIFQPAILKEQFLYLYQNSERLSLMSENANALGVKDASEKLADIILKI